MDTENLAKMMPHKHIAIKEEMDCHLLQYYKKQFKHDHGVLFIEPLMNHLIHFNTSTLFCNATRRTESTIQDLPVEEVIKECLKVLQTYETDPLPVDITYHVVHQIKGFKIWNESKATLLM
eukprot:1441303-Ditylum_brightwellii.AAC.1